MFLVFLLRLGLEPVPRQASLEFSLARRPGSGMSGELSKRDGCRWDPGRKAEPGYTLPSSNYCPPIRVRTSGPAWSDGSHFLWSFFGGAWASQGALWAWEGRWLSAEKGVQFWGVGGGGLNSVPGPGCEAGREARGVTVSVCFPSRWAPSGRLRLGPFPGGSHGTETLEQRFHMQNPPGASELPK